MSCALVRELPQCLNRLAGFQTKFRLLLWAAFLIAYLLAGAPWWLSSSLADRGRWLDALLLVLATATTLVEQTRVLPGQNVLLVAVIITLISCLVPFLASLTGAALGTIPVGGNREISDFLPWLTPLWWIVMVLTSRGTARFILGRWKNDPHYGFWLLGLTVLLVLPMELGLQWFATEVKGYWSWKISGGVPGWFAPLWVHFVGSGVTALLILVVATPALINKKPITSSGGGSPNTNSTGGAFVALWLLLNFLFVTTLALHHPFRLPW